MLTKTLLWLRSCIQQSSRIPLHSFVCLTYHLFSTYNFVIFVAHNSMILEDFLLLKKKTDIILNSFDF